MKEIFLPFRSPVAEVPRATIVRSTVVVSGIQAFRAEGLYDQYVAHLTETSRPHLTSLIPGSWVPIEIALDHYRAADRLGLSPDRIDSIGFAVADRLHRSALSVMVKMSKEVGVTPWTALACAQRLNDLNWKGSDVSVTKLGPKEARYDWIGVPCADVPYFVTSFGGFVRSLASLFCSRAYTRILRERLAPTSLSYQLSWV